MTLHDASKEFELDCKVRHLSPKTIDNYTKQLRYLENHLSIEFSMFLYREFVSEAVRILIPAIKMEDAKKVSIQVSGFLITCENPYMKPFFGCAHLYGDFSCRPLHMRKEEKSSFSNKGGRNLQMSLHFPPIDISRLEEDAGKCLFQATFQRLSVMLIGRRSFA